MITKSILKNKHYVHYSLKHSEGFMLVELLVALAILMLVVFAVTPLLVGSIKQITFAGDKSEALYQGQADIEVKIVEKDVIDGYEVEFYFGDDLGEGTTVTVPGALIEVEKSKGEAVAWLSTFLPYVPSIKLSDSFIIEGYDGQSVYLPIVIMGRDTKLNDDDYVYIYTQESFEQGDLQEYTLPFQLVAPPDGQPLGYDEYATFDLPAGSAGLTNANSIYIVELKWTVEDISVKVRARLHVLLPFAVAVGEIGEIVVSPDASEIWNLRNNEVNLGSSINDVIWASFRYIAVTSNGTALIWGDKEEPREIGISDLGNIPLNSVAFGNGIIVAVGDGGTVAVSSDGGEYWTLEGPVTREIVGGGEEVLTSNLNAVSYSDGKFMAVGVDRAIITSENGSGWVWDNCDDIDASVDFYGLAYGNGVWIVAGDKSQTVPAESKRSVIYRGDGNGWYEIFVDEDKKSRFNDVSFDLETGSKFVAVGAVGDVGMIMTSPDGVTWTVSSSPTSGGLYAILWDGLWNQQFLIVGENGTIITGDGVNWSTHTSGNSKSLKGVATRWEN